MNLPEEIIARMDDFIATGRWGFRDRDDLARAAVREYLQRYSGRPDETGEPLVRSSPSKKDRS